jgi:probable selenium-dependent hydroxylase accessory protein YqeC
MTLVDALGIDFNTSEVICFVGAGGKTTAMFTLAKEFKRLWKRVLVTTTTNIYYPDKGECDDIVISDVTDRRIFNRVIEKGIIGFGREVINGRKLTGVKREFIEDLHREKIFDHILVEADGSKRKPIKAPANYEPVIPSNTTKTVGVIGLDAVGTKINTSSVHRPELFCSVTGTHLGDAIDEEAIVKLIVSPEGLFKEVTAQNKKYLLLNKAEDIQRRSSALLIIDLLKERKTDIKGFIVASMAGGTIFYSETV